MVFAGHYLKIGEPIIQAVFIFMVNNF